MNFIVFSEVNVFSLSHSIFQIAKIDNHFSNFIKINVAQQKGAQKINELIFIAIGMLNKGFNITKSCVQNDFHQNWEFKFKFNLNKLEKRYTNSINCLVKMRIKTN